jgi:hypothetical protein
VLGDPRDGSGGVVNPSKLPHDQLGAVPVNHSFRYGWWSQGRPAPRRQQDRNLCRKPVPPPPRHSHGAYGVMMDQNHLSSGCGESYIVSIVLSKELCRQCEFKGIRA